MASVGSLIFDIVANVGRMRTDFQQATGVLTKFQRDAERVSGFVSKAMSFSIAGVGLNALAASVKHIADLGEQINKMSIQTGIGAEKLSLLKYAADVSETSMDSLNIGMKAFQKALSGVNEDGNETAMLLKSIGVNAKDPYDALLQVSKAFKQVGDANDRSRLAVELFGKSGRDLLPLLLNLDDALADAKKNAHIFTEADARAMDEFNDGLTRMKANFGNLAATVAGPVIGAFNDWFAILGKAGKADNLYRELDNINNQISGILKDNELWNNLKKAWGFAASDMSEKDKAKLQGLKDLRQQILDQLWDLQAPAKAGTLTPAFKAPKVTGSGGKDEIDWVYELAKLQAENMKEEEAMLERRVKVYQGVVDRIKKLTLSDYDYQRYEAQRFYAEQEKILGDTAELKAGLAQELRMINDQEAAAMYESWLNSVEGLATAFSELPQALRTDMVPLLEEMILKFSELGLVGTDAFKQMTEELMKFREEERGAKKQGEDIGKAFAGEITAGLGSFFHNAKNGFEDMGKVALDVLDSIYEMMIKLLVLKPLEGAITGWLSPATGKAGGGPVSAFTPYIVGENGPELFASSVSGTIVPNNVLRGMSAGSSVQSAPNITINVQNESSQPVDAKMGGFKFDGEKWVLNVLLKDMMGNGPYHRALQAGKA